MLIYVIVGAVASVLLLLLNRYDMYDREPWYLLLLTLILGGLSAWTIGFVEDAIINHFRIGQSMAGIAITAASCEEAVKLLTVVLLAACFRKHFNDPMDGIVYGAVAGLGFALEESRFYLTLSQSTFPKPSTLQLFGQETIRLILHFITGGLDGFGIGLWWAQIKQWKVILPTWVMASFGIHMLWDYACGLPTGDGVFQRGIAVMLMLAGLLLFAMAVVVGNRWSRNFHPPEDESQRLVRWPFTLIIRERRR